jgi:hypothetical protein
MNGERAHDLHLQATAPKSTGRAQRLQPMPALRRVPHFAHHISIRNDEGENIVDRGYRPPVVV